MKKSLIIIKRNLFIYKGEEYNFDNLTDLINLLKTNIKIVILEEELYVKQFISDVRKNKMFEFIDYKINNDFLQNGDILYDFEIKNNVIAIYSIKGAKRIEKLCAEAKNIEVKPIQFIVKDIMLKRLKNNNFNCKVLIKFNEYYYYITFKEGLFYYGFIEKDKELLFDKIIKNCDFGKIYVDKTINDLSHENKFEIIEIDIGELINEKIYEKQRFCSRKIL